MISSPSLIFTFGKPFYDPVVDPRAAGGWPAERQTRPPPMIRTGSVCGGSRAKRRMKAAIWLSDPVSTITLLPVSFVVGVNRGDG